MLAQQLGQPGVVRVGVRPRQQPVQLRVDLAPQHRIAVVADRPPAPLQRHRPPQQRRHPAAEPHRAPGLGLLDLRAPLQQVGRALALGEVQRVVGQEAVADQHPLVVLAQDLDDHLVAPARADAVERGVLVGEDPQPGRAAADLPAGLVDVLHRAVAGRLDQAVVAGPGQPPQAVAAADQRRRGDDQPGEGQQHRGALAVRGAEAVLQVGGEARAAAGRTGRRRPPGRRRSARGGGPGPGGSRPGSGPPGRGSG